MAIIMIFSPVANFGTHPLDPSMASLVSEGTTAAEKTPLASNPLVSDQEGSRRGVVFKELFWLTIYPVNRLYF